MEKSELKELINTETNSSARDIIHHLGDSLIKGLLDINKKAVNDTLVQVEMLENRLK